MKYAVVAQLQQLSLQTIQLTLLLAGVVGGFIEGTSLGGAAVRCRLVAKQQ